MLRDSCDENCVIPKATQCSELGNGVENQLSATNYNLINKQGVRDGSIGYNKRTSKKLFLNQYPEYFTFLHVFLKASFARETGCKPAVGAVTATFP